MIYINIYDGYKGWGGGKDVERVMLREAVRAERANKFYVGNAG